MKVHKGKGKPQNHEVIRIEITNFILSEWMKQANEYLNGTAVSIPPLIGHIERNKFMSFIERHHDRYQKLMDELQLLAEDYLVLDENKNVIFEEPGKILTLAGETPKSPPGQQPKMKEGKTFEDYERRVKQIMDRKILI